MAAGKGSGFLPICGKEPERASIRREGFVEIRIPDEAATVCTIEMQSAGGRSVVVQVPISASDLVTRIVETRWGREESSSIKRLLQLLFGSSTEKSRRVHRGPTDIGCT